VTANLKTKKYIYFGPWCYTVVLYRPVRVNSNKVENGMFRTTR